MHFLKERLYFPVPHLEPKIWENEKSMFKYAESIIEIVETIADVGDKSANRRSTNQDTADF